VGCLQWRRRGYATLTTHYSSLEVGQIEDGPHVYASDVLRVPQTVRCSDHMCICMLRTVRLIWQTSGGTSWFWRDQPANTWLNSVKADRPTWPPVVKLPVVLPQADIVGEHVIKTIEVVGK
jgi:hypothetical protein